MKRLIPVAVAVAALAVAGITAPPAARAAVSQPKVVIVVGAMGYPDLYTNYIAAADSAANTFGKYTSNIVKVYSPKATYSAVAAAAQGANVLVYVGHGSGWPNPYTTSHQPSTNNGMGLNPAGATSDTRPVYSGEDGMAQLALAPDALVLLWKACYTAGNSEDGKTAPTLAVAKERVDGYASGFIRAGASAVIAEPHGDIRPYVDALFNSDPTTTIEYIWKHGYDSHNNVFSWTSIHKDADGIDDYAGWGTLSQEDPDVPNPTGGNVFWRSMVARTSTTVGQILAGAFNPNVSRWSGPDRYATAASVSAHAFPTAPVPIAFVALGTNFPDALAGAASAGSLGGPVILVTSSSIPASAATELSRLKPAKIYILGSSGVISTDVEQALDQYSPTVKRLGGTDRYETASMIALATFSPGVPVAFVALGSNFPDALAGAAVAGKLRGPVLLTASKSLPDATADALTTLKPAKIVILGSEGVIDASVADALDKYTTGGVDRWYGADRYATAVDVSQHAYPKAGVPIVFIASGLTFPDALAGAAAAGRLGGPLLIVPGGTIPTSVAEELRLLQPQKIVVLGGPSVVSGAVFLQLAAFVPDA